MCDLFGSWVLGPQKEKKQTTTEGVRKYILTCYPLKDIDVAQIGPCFQNDYNSRQAESGQAEKNHPNTGALCSPTMIFLSCTP